MTEDTSAPVLGEPEEIAASDAPVVEPWRRVVLDPDYGGCWVVAGDVDGDGVVEIISAQNYNEDDVHHTTTAVAQKLDGTVLWRWGDPSVGRRRLHHDVACQIHDWDGDGLNEVILCGDGVLVHLEGATGREIRRFPIPPRASDSLSFANLSGSEWAREVLVKTRYTDVWAYSYDGDLLWNAHMPGGYRTSHQARPIDIDGDRRDEVMAGYALLNPDGSVRWVYESDAVDLTRGHLDAMRVLRAGPRPGDYRLVLTACGANAIALVDGEGRALWEVAGHHFESVDVRRICPDVEGPQIAMDIDHRPRGESPVWILDEEGRRVSEFVTVYSRSHHLVDWSGTGMESLAIGGAYGLFSCRGSREATLPLMLPDGHPDPDPSPHVTVGDMTGNGVGDLMFSTGSAAYIFRNVSGRASGAPLGSGTNYTLY